MATNDDETSTGGTDPRRIALYGVLIALVGVYLSPLYSGLTTSLKTQQAYRETSPLQPPLEGLTIDPWLTAASELAFAMVNSFAMVVPATILSAVFGSLAAYGLTKVDWRGQALLLALFLAAVFIPYQAVLVPLRQFWSIVDISSLHARGELVELTITHIAYGIPICTILFRSYYRTLDDELMEAARLDGASLARIYRKIVLPLSLPMFAVTLIYQFTQVWNDFLFALVLLSDRANYVVTLELNALAGAMATDYGVQMAGAFIAALPTIVVYVLFGEQFAKGQTL
ncbi:carbohydrate ABC transporter permease [Natronobacterium gregoryi]|uniref:ABC-type sugar transport system, permease component n=2 Tax=Natronobacterium gregoryi TaxID=44930 RepID=L0ALG9_NATGS|nr:carbohydrate ABC transporter permease [Natronobacterium gregoryi]AFZ74738.1 ABC-type sugar transport system, permease component [Natronobacterium gregoryi SP2]ELY73454.1 sugar ABC transporter permease [Natronobacterium gregoryi SP2]PLK20980.1 carbohydrate ABC transporter permease [Natronobacterium gregoryi SP2]SFJ03673.1 carbohydrate ABC transporter membrane protein 2, CUT1 family [Natronobacterium gregoryi]